MTSSTRPTVSPDTGAFYAFARYALPRLEQAFAPGPQFVARPSFTLAASDDMPHAGLATNARVPLAPMAESAPDTEPPAAPRVEAQPGFQDE